MKDSFKLGNKIFNSRFILGSGKYSYELIESAINQAGAEIITVALRRAIGGSKENILDFIPKDIVLLPNTSGARNAEEAIRIARLSRECAGTDFIKIEIIRDSKYLLPDNQETIKATKILADEGFYCYAVYVSRLKCRKRPKKCRSCLYNASCGTNRLK